MAELHAGQPQLPDPMPAAFGAGIDCTELNVLDPSSALNRIINPGSGFSVSATFRIGGVVTPFVETGAVNFTVDYYYESFGDGPEGTLGSVTVAPTPNINITPLPSSPPLREYSGAATTLAVPPGTIPDPGTYKLTAVVNYPGLVPMTAFIEGPLIQVR